MPKYRVCVMVTYTVTKDDPDTVIDSTESDLYDVLNSTPLRDMDYSVRMGEAVKLED